MGKKKHWHRHRPPWWDEEHWQEWAERHPHSPAWWEEEDRPEGSPLPNWFKHRRTYREWRHGDKALFARFAIAFGLFVLLGCGALLAFADSIVSPRSSRTDLSFSPKVSMVHLPYGQTWGGGAKGQGRGPEMGDSGTAARGS